MLYLYKTAMFPLQLRCRGFPQSFKLLRCQRAQSTVGIASPKDLPGFDRPVYYTPIPACGERVDQEQGEQLYPTALRLSGAEFEVPATTLRELSMVRMMDQVTDKPNWATKVFNPSITSKWKQEALDLGKEVFSQRMADSVIEELRQKAMDWKASGMVFAYDPGVVKSDAAISQELNEDLRGAVRPLEQVADTKKDWHPGSDDKVLDLVHPSLFPLVYGRTKVLSDRHVNFPDAVADAGLGEILKERPHEELEQIKRERPYWDWSLKAISEKFQWLPCDLEFKEGKLNIKSYINNLHPQKHPDLYRAIEKITQCVLPLWNATLSSWPPKPNRIIYDTVKYDAPIEDLIPKSPDPGETEEAFWKRQYQVECQLREKHLILPEPEYDTQRSLELRENLQEKFSRTGLQVIVKLANIHLTPDKPSYDGGTWHVEGQLNEHICATALYYYDSENITESRLAFRKSLDEDEFIDMDYEQNDNDWLLRIYDYGHHDEEEAVQELGSVDCREGRVITFPNILQHKVLPFELKDKTKPGHRKILALFLVDPHMKIISTANVPPQQHEWLAERVQDNLRNATVMRNRKVVEEAVAPSMMMDEAKELRLELMKERTALADDHDLYFKGTVVSLCEH